MREREDRKCEHVDQNVDRAGGAFPHERHRRAIQNLRDGRFADPTQPEAGEGDAELGDGQVAIQSANDRLGQNRLPLALSRARAKLRRPDFDERELGRDEEPVEGDAERGNDQAPHGEPFVSRPGPLAAPRRRQPSGRGLAAKVGPPAAGREKLGSMRNGHLLFCVAISVGSAFAERNALAFGGTADRLGQQGNFVVSNRASLGFDQGLSYAGTSISFAPELDYFVVPHLSIGGAVIVDWDSTNGASAGVVPQVGYDVVLSDSWSFWPRLAIPLTSGPPFHASVELSAPFLIHPAEHFFFGFGPAFSTDLAGANKITHLFGAFLIGGYFSS